MLGYRMLCVVKLYGIVLAWKSLHQRCTMCVETNTCNTWFTDKKYIAHQYSSKEIILIFEEMSKK